MLFCAGDTATPTIDGTEYTFQGSGDSTACEALLDQFVHKVDDSLCHPKPCAIGSTYQPTIPEDMEFYTCSFQIYSICIRNCK